MLRTLLSAYMTWLSQIKAHDWSFQSLIKACDWSVLCRFVSAEIRLHPCWSNKMCVLLEPSGNCATL